MTSFPVRGLYDALSQGWTFNNPSQLDHGEINLVRVHLLPAQLAPGVLALMEIVQRKKKWEKSETQGAGLMRGLQSQAACDRAATVSGTEV